MDRRARFPTPCRARPDLPLCARLPGVLSLALLSGCGSAREDVKSPSLTTPPVPSLSVKPEALAPSAPAVSEKTPAGTVSIKLLGINDFHGQLAPKTISGRPVGGAAALAARFRRASAEAEGRTFIVHAGDLVGASPLASSLLQDEPAIMFLNALANDSCSASTVASGPCNVIGTVGNHEFDEGTTELLRLLRGGDSPKGPFIERPWRGARFPYVCSNVVDRSSGKSIFPPYVIEHSAGVAVAFIGATLQTTPSIVPAPGIATIAFEDEAESINRAVREVRAQGVHAIVVLVHDGLNQPSYTSSTDPTAPAPTGAFLSVLARLDDDVDVVVSGHTHHFTNALVQNAHGTPILVVQAFSSGTAYDDVDLVVDEKTDDVVAKSAKVVTPFADDGVEADAAVARIVAEAEAVAAPIGNTVVGEAAAALSRVPNAAGESVLGDFLADAQRESVHAELALVNPGGIRDDVPRGKVTYGMLFSVQPFGNTVVQVALTGQQIYDLLNQQWGRPQPVGGRVMQISGFSYTWDSHVPEGGERIVEVRDGANALLSRTRKYVVAVNDYMLSGGDDITVLAKGERRAAGAVDIEALAAYVKRLPRPFSPPPGGRITRR